jgi:hypothetical protein
MTDKILIDCSVVEQVLGALVRAEMMYQQPNKTLQAALRAALEQPQGEQEPVAWMCTETRVLYDTDTRQVDKHHGFKPTVPLYTHPQPPRQPLTPEQLEVLMPKPREKGWIYTGAQVRSFARKVERAHGIGGEK